MEQEMRTVLRFVSVLPTLVMLGLLASMLLTLEGCCDHECMVERFSGGGQDAVTVHMPFEAGYGSRCVQGPGGDYSHSGRSTGYDADFDTPNDEDVVLYAPVSGTVAVHDNNSSRGFGNHLNIDMGDGTYLLLGHMSTVFVNDGAEVATGQMLGYEGTTGYSTGDHVHIGRHDGDAEADGTWGESIEGLTFATTVGNLSVMDLTCDLSGGTTYYSLLETPRWHPNGSLVKTPSDAAVYLLEDGAARAFYTENAFFSRGYSFADVALVDEGEMDCYSTGLNITGINDISAVHYDGRVWLVFPEDHEVRPVASADWQTVLRTWGIAAATVNDLPRETERAAFSGYTFVTDEVRFRDGALISEESSSTVYVIADGIAMPIETWETFLLMGFGGREVLEVSDGVVDTVMDRVGDCGTNAYCITREDVLTCGGPLSQDEGTYASTSLDIAWVTPDGLPAERITLAGEYVHADGRVDAWRTLAETAGEERVAYTLLEPASGDSLRFSVEYVQGGVTSWSCVAPYPPGTTQGLVAATYNGDTINVLPADDPASSGCGLRVTIP